MSADNIVTDFGRSALTPAAFDRLLTHNIAACREQNKLRAEGKLPVYRRSTRQHSRNRA